MHFRTKTYKRFLLESAIVRDMELYQDGTIVVAPISLAMMDAIGATSEDSDDIASFLGQLEGALCRWYSVGNGQFLPAQQIVDGQSGKRLPLLRHIPAENQLRFG